MQQEIVAKDHVNNKTISRIGWFVLLSLLLHLMLLAGVQRERIALPAAPARTASLSVQLQPSYPVHHPKSAPEQKQAKTAKPQPEAIPKQTHPQAPSAPEPSPGRASKQAAAPSPATEPTPAADSRIDSAQVESIKVILQKQLAHYFRYPLLARRHGWEGEVVLAFRIETDGTIMNAHIAHSSGYGVLDRAALHALGKVKRINQTLRHEQAMQIPVIYRLKEG